LKKKMKESYRKKFLNGFYKIRETKRRRKKRGEINDPTIFNIVTKITAKAV